MPKARILAILAGGRIDLLHRVAPTEAKRISSGFPAILRSGVPARVSLKSMGSKDFVLHWGCGIIWSYGRAWPPLRYERCHYCYHLRLTSYWGMFVMLRLKAIGLVRQYRKTRPSTRLEGMSRHLT